MGADRTVLRKGQPRFGIYETAYLRASATRGFIEPLFIIGIEFDPARNDWVYTWGREFGRNSKPSPVKVYESELLTVCEALAIQIPVLTRQRAVLQAQMVSTCPNGATTLTQVAYGENSDGSVRPPSPLFGYNEVVYLRESAQATGNLEAFRITDIKWNQSLFEWVYYMYIKRRPGRNMTVGDRGDMTREFELSYPESVLCPVCEALPLAISYFDRAINSLTLRYNGLCPDVTGSTGTT